MYIGSYVFPGETAQTLVAQLKEIRKPWWGFHGEELWIISRSFSRDREDLDEVLYKFRERLFLFLGKNVTFADLSWQLGEQLPPVAPVETVEGDLTSTMDGRFSYFEWDPAWSNHLGKFGSAAVIGIVGGGRDEVVGDFFSDPWA